MRVFWFLRKRNRDRIYNEWFSSAKDGPLSPKPLFELFLFSMAVFVFSALLMQFLLTLQTALLLKIYSISFTYRLFAIGSSMVSPWPETRIILVFGFGVLVFFGVGIWLAKSLKNPGPIKWKARLVLTWMAFLMVQTFPLSLLAGIIFYDGFGIAYQWMFNSIFVRAAIGFVALLVIMIMRPFWLNLFLKTAYSSTFLTDYKNSKLLIKISVILPWIAGVLILLPFVYLHHAWFWLVYLCGIGFVVLPFFGNNIPPRNFLITKSDKTIFNIRYPLPVLLAVLAFLLVADYMIKINF